MGRTDKKKHRLSRKCACCVVPRASSSVGKKPGALLPSSDFLLENNLNMFCVVLNQSSSELALAPTELSVTGGEDSSSSETLQNNNSTLENSSIITSTKISRQLAAVADPLNTASSKTSISDLNYVFAEQSQSSPPSPLTVVSLASRIS